MNLVEYLIVFAFPRVILMEPCGDFLRIGGIEFRTSGDGVGSVAECRKIGGEPIWIDAAIRIGSHQNTAGSHALGSEIHRQPASMAGGRLGFGQADADGRNGNRQAQC
jgi:hypothetical protein